MISDNIIKVTFSAKINGNTIYKQVLIAAKTLKYQMVHIDEHMIVDAYREFKEEIQHDIYPPPTDNGDSTYIDADRIIKGDHAITGSPMLIGSGCIGYTGSPFHTRGFEVISEYLRVYKDLTLPTRATKYSAGYDISALCDTYIPAFSTILVPTGLKAYMRTNEFLGLYIRSSVARKLGLTLANGVAVIDSDYYNNPDNDGHIQVMLRNTTSAAVLIEKGQRIAQAIFHTYLTTDDDEVTMTRTGGVGSTGN